MRRANHSLDRAPWCSEDSLLLGETVTDPEVLTREFARSRFYYQFARGAAGGGQSRIMSCSDPNELAWLKGQVNKRTPIIVQPGA